MSRIITNNPSVDTINGVLWEGKMDGGAIGVNLEVLYIKTGSEVEVIGSSDGISYSTPLRWIDVSDPTDNSYHTAPIRKHGYYFVEAGTSPYVRVYLARMVGADPVISRASFAYELLSPVAGAAGAVAPPVKIDLPTLHKIDYSSIAAAVAGGRTVEDAIINYLKTAGTKLVDNDLVVVSGAGGSDSKNNGAWVLNPKPTDATVFIPTKLTSPAEAMHLVKNRVADTTPPATSLPEGFQIFTVEKNRHEIGIVTKSGTIISLFSDTDINERIASGSLFQGAVKTAAELTALPTPSGKNRGFYWTWQGPTNFTITGVTGSVVDATVGIPGEKLNVGDWLQSDGTKWLHISSDLLSRKRWDTLGGFQPYTAGTYEQGSLVTHRLTANSPLHYYQASVAVTATDPAPGATGSTWVDITPQLTLAGLFDVDVTTTPLADGDYLKWDGALNKFVNKAVNDIDEYDSSVTYRKGDIVITNGGIWRARQGGKLPEPTRKDNNAYLTIKATGYNPEEIFQVTSISAAAPDTSTDVSSSVGHKFHLEWHDDSNWKVYAYDKVTKTWHELAGMAHTLWRSYGEPPDPDRNNSIMLWIKGSKSNRTTPTVAAPEWEHFRIATSLAALDDVRLVAETPGQTLVLDRTGKWVAGSPAAHIPEWTANSRDFNIGDVTHYEGRFWRANNNGSTLAKPEMANGACVYIYDNAGKTGVLVIKQVGAVAPTTVPANLTEVYLRYVSDTDWEVFTVTVNTTTHALEWAAMPAPTSKTLWRHVALPPGGHGSYGILWIYSMPHSTTAPVAGQTDWSPILLGDFLVSLADVSAPNPKAGEVLTSDGAGKWTPVAVDAYTKLETDTKIGDLIRGVSHEASVRGILNTPPATPAEGDAYIVGTAPTGAWAGFANQVMTWDALANPAKWVRDAPEANEAHLVEDQDATYHWNGTQWNKVAQGLAYPKLVAWRTGHNHSDNGPDSWTVDANVKIYLNNLVPVGNIFKLEVSFTGYRQNENGLLVLTHLNADTFYQHGAGQQEHVSQPNSRFTSGYRCLTDVSQYSSMDAFIMSQAKGGSNFSRDIWFQMLLWDLGPSGNVPRLG